MDNDTLNINYNNNNINFIIHKENLDLKRQIHLFRDISSSFDFIISFPCPQSLKTDYYQYSNLPYSVVGCWEPHALIRFDFSKLLISSVIISITINMQKSVYPSNVSCFVWRSNTYSKSLWHDHSQYLTIIIHLCQLFSNVMHGILTLLSSFNMSLLGHVLEERDINPILNSTDQQLHRMCMPRWHVVHQDYHRYLTSSTRCWGLTKMYTHSTR